MNDNFVFWYHVCVLSRKEIVEQLDYLYEEWYALSDSIAFVL